jgi:hypothetical protein
MKAENNNEKLNTNLVFIENMVYNSVTIKDVVLSKKLDDDGKATTYRHDNSKLEKLITENRNSIFFEHLTETLEFALPIFVASILFLMLLIVCTNV